MNNVALQSLRMEDNNLWCWCPQKSKTKNQRQDCFDGVEHITHNITSFRYRWFS
jgi:hypothetical protein